MSETQLPEKNIWAMKLGPSYEDTGVSIEHALHEQRDVLIYRTDNDVAGVLLSRETFEVFRRHYQELRRLSGPAPTPEGSGTT